MNDILKYKNIYLTFSSILILLSIGSIAYFGFNLGIDFESGSLWQVSVPNTTPEELRGFFRDELGIDEINITIDSNDSYVLSFKEINESERVSYLEQLTNRFGEGVESLDFWTISPSISSELKEKAEIALILVPIAISLFIAFAFRKVSDPIKSWKYGVITLITLLHDVVIPAGIFAALGAFYGVTIDTNFVVAVLFVVGFSVNDTIVVFDRIRERLLKLTEEGKRIDLTEVVNSSIQSTIARSINTSLTLIAVLLALFFLGPVNTQMFILAILIGTIAGTYSSIFFASPLLVVSQRFSGKKKKG